MASHVTVDAHRCTGCGLCVPVCPNHLLKPGTALNAQGLQPVVMVDEQYCLNGLDCLAVCPHDALLPPTAPERNLAGTFYWMGRQLGKASKWLPNRPKGDRE